MVILFSLFFSQYCWCKCNYATSLCSRLYGLSVCNTAVFCVLRFQQIRHIVANLSSVIAVATTVRLLGCVPKKQLANSAMMGVWCVWLVVYTISCNQPKKSIRASAAPHTLAASMCAELTARKQPILPTWDRTCAVCHCTKCKYSATSDESRRFSPRIASSSRGTLSHLIWSCCRCSPWSWLQYDSSVWLCLKTGFCFVSVRRFDDCSSCSVRCAVFGRYCLCCLLRSYLCIFVFAP